GRSGRPADLRDGPGSSQRQEDQERVGRRRRGGVRPVEHRADAVIREFDIAVLTHDIPQRHQLSFVTSAEKKHKGPAPCNPEPAPLSRSSLPSGDYQAQLRPLFSQRFTWAWKVRTVIRRHRYMIRFLLSAGFGGWSGNDDRPSLRRTSRRELEKQQLQ